MKTQLIAITTAAAIAFTGLTAAPAQAGSGGEFARFLVGAAIIGVIASEVNKNNRPAVSERPHRYTPKPKKQPRHRVYYQQKPRLCLRQRMTEFGWKTFYGKRCMANNGWERHDGRGWHAHRNNVNW